MLQEQQWRQAKGQKDSHPHHIPIEFTCLALVKTRWTEARGDQGDPAAAVVLEVESFFFFLEPMVPRLGVLSELWPPA